MQSTPDTGALDAANAVALSAAQAEVLALYVAVGVLGAIILILLLAVIVLMVCFCTNRPVVYSLKSAENDYSPPPPSKHDTV